MHVQIICLFMFQFYNFIFGCILIISNVSKRVILLYMILSTACQHFVNFNLFKDIQNFQIELIIRNSVF